MYTSDISTSSTGPAGRCNTRSSQITRPVCFLDNQPLIRRSEQSFYENTSIILPFCPTTALITLEITFARAKTGAADGAGTLAG